MLVGQPQQPGRLPQRGGLLAADKLVGDRDHQPSAGYQTLPAHQFCLGCGPVVGDHGHTQFGVGAQQYRQLTIGTVSADQLGACHRRPALPGQVGCADQSAKP